MAFLRQIYCHDPLWCNNPTWSHLGRDKIWGHKEDLSSQGDGSKPPFSCLHCLYVRTPQHSCLCPCNTNEHLQANKSSHRIKCNRYLVGGIQMWICAHRIPTKLRGSPKYFNWNPSKRLAQELRKPAKNCLSHNMRHHCPWEKNPELSMRISA